MEHCLQAVRAKDAWWLVREFSLHARFPAAEALYRRHTLRALAERQRWNAAVAFCAGDAELQACILSHNPTLTLLVHQSHIAWGRQRWSAALAFCADVAKLQVHVNAH